MHRRAALFAISNVLVISHMVIFGIGFGPMRDSSPYLAEPPYGYEPRATRHAEQHSPFDPWKGFEGGSSLGEVLMLRPAFCRWHERPQFWQSETKKS